MKPTPITTKREAFGLWLRERIEERRAGPMAFVARAVGLTPSEMCNALAGRRQLRGALYLRVAKAIGLSPQETEEGLALWRASFRPQGRQGAGLKAKLLEGIADTLARLVNEGDKDERELIGVELRNLIAKL